MSNELKRILLAAAGAVGLAKDEAVKLLDRLVERGEVAADEAKAVMKKLQNSSAAKSVRVTAGRAQDAAGRALDGVIDSLGLTTRARVETLEKEIASLRAKLKSSKKPRTRP